MGNQALSFNLRKHSSHSRYSRIDHTSNVQSSLQESQLDQWDSSWKDVTHQNIYYRIEYGKFNTFRNDLTSEEVQRYQIILNDKNDFQKWKEIVHWRNNSQHLPKIQHFSLQNKGEVCVSQFQINLFIEKMPLRLVDLTDIPYPENIYFLLSVLKGFKYIFASPFPVKSFRVTQTMVCLNKEGQVKVWLNPNLSESEPINEKNTTYATQEEILRSLIDMVQQNTDQRDYPYPFRQYLVDQHILINGDYNSIIQQLYAYAKDMNITIPKYAFSVRDILSKDFLSMNKVESENSFSHKPHFRRQNSSFRRDASLSVLNSLDFQPSRKLQADNGKQASKAQLFPKQKTHGLISPNKLIANHNFPTVNELPSLNQNLPPNHNNHYLKPQHQSQLINHTKVQNIHPDLRNQFVTNLSFTDRNYSSNNLNTHLTRINKIGNNIIQFHQPDLSYRPPLYQPHFSPQKNQIRQAHSLEKPFNHNLNFNMPSLPPQGYRMVERKIVHPIGYNPFHSAKIQSFTPSFSPPKSQPQKDIRTYQIPQNKNFQNIERVNSTKTSFPMGQTASISKFNKMPPEIQTASFLSLTSTKRPEQISSNLQIERINRQLSCKTFKDNENSQENMRKTNSFKNNLIKNQHEEQEVGRTVGNVKYFTKKDSQQTLDPQIAGDLMKYLGQNA